MKKSEASADKHFHSEDLPSFSRRSLPKRPAAQAIMEQNFGRFLLLVVAIITYCFCAIQSILITKELLDDVSLYRASPICVSVIRYFGVCAAKVCLSSVTKAGDQDQLTHSLADSGKPTLPILAYLTFLLDITSIRYNTVEFYFTATALTPAVIGISILLTSSKSSTPGVLLTVSTVLSWMVVVMMESQAGSVRLPGLLSGLALSCISPPFFNIDVRLNKKALLTCFVLLLFSGDLMSVVFNSSKWWYLMGLSTAFKVLEELTQSFIRHSSEKLSFISFAFKSLLLTIVACFTYREPKSIGWVVGNLLLVASQGLLTKVIKI